MQNPIFKIFANIEKFNCILSRHNSCDAFNFTVLYPSVVVEMHQNNLKAMQNLAFVQNIWEICNVNKLETFSMCQNNQPPSPPQLNLEL